MKTRIFRILALVLLVCVFVFSMTGCEKLDYRQALHLYNTGNYEAALDIFTALGDYEDAQSLCTDCQYWIAANLAEKGAFEKALPQFQELGNYRNCPQWVTECKYQIAVAAFNEDWYEKAQEYFMQTPDYKNTPEYQRRLNWVAMYDAVIDAGFDAISDTHITDQINGKEYSIVADEYANELTFSVYSFTNDPFHFSDGLEITLTRDSTVASYVASTSFAMDYLDDRIYSNQTAAGKIDITTCTPKTKLVMETYEKFAKDNHGEHTESTDPADSRMHDVMAENLSDLLPMIPVLLAQNGITVTLQDIGFYAL